MTGYIILPRELYNHPIMHSGNALQCFLRILYDARFKEGMVYHNGIEVELQRGQCVLSRNSLALDLRLTPSQVRYAIDKLEYYRLISVHSTRHYSIVTVNHFDEYQPQSQCEIMTNVSAHDLPTEKQPQRRIKSSVCDGYSQQDNQQNDSGKANIKKKVNNNINNNIYIREFEEFWSKYPNRFNRPQTEKNFIKAAKAHGTDAVLRALDNYLAEIEAEGREKKYIVRSTNFVGQKAYFLGYLDADSENQHEEKADGYMEAVPNAVKTQELLNQLRGG